MRDERRQRGESCQDLFSDDDEADSNFIALCLNAYAPYHFDCAKTLLLQQPRGNVINEEETHLFEGVQLFAVDEGCAAARYVLKIDWMPLVTARYHGKRLALEKAGQGPILPPWELTFVGWNASHRPGMIKEVSPGFGQLDFTFHSGDRIYDTQTPDFILEFQHFAISGSNSFPE